eukprot:250531_1
MAVVTEIHFELTVPNPNKFKQIYMKPVNNSFLLKEVLQDIDNIISNTDHEQVYQYTEALIKFKRIKCFFCIFLIITILIAGIWAAYIFVVCSIITKSSNSCDYMDYTNNRINQVCWCTFIVTLIITLIIIIYGKCSFNNKTKTIVHQWITSIKQEIQFNIDERKYKSPQHSFNLNYQTNYRSKYRINGILTVNKRSSKIEHIIIDSNTELVEDQNSQELVYLNQTTPITEQSNTGHGHQMGNHQPQISMEMLNEYANQNNAMLNQLVQQTNQSSHDIQIIQNINSQMQISGGSQSNLHYNQPMIHNNMSYSNASKISNNNLNINNNNMCQLPPIIPDPIDIVDTHIQDNKYENQYANGAGDYGQNAQYNDFV